MQLSIKNFLIISIVIGLFISVFLSYKYIIGLDVEKNTKPLTNINIISFYCSGTAEIGSSIEVKYFNRYYRVGVTSNQCEEIKRGKLPILYYNEKEDIVFISNGYFNYSYSIVAFLLLVVIPLFGFYIYKDELNNSYKMM